MERWSAARRLSTSHCWWQGSEAASSKSGWRTLLSSAFRAPLPALSPVGRGCLYTLVGDYFRGVVLGFDHPDLQQARGFEVWLQALKRRECDVFRGRDDAPQEVHIPVQMAVVDRVHELATQDGVHVLEVDDHAGLRIECAADCDLDHVVVPVIGRASAEDVAVLLVAPVLATQDVRGGEGGAARDAQAG